MRWIYGCMMSILALGALMIFQASLIKSSNQLASAFIGCNNAPLESTMRGIYNPTVVSNVGSLEFDLKDSLLMYDNKKQQLIISSNPISLAPQEVELLTTIKTKDSRISVLNKSLNKIDVNIVNRKKDLRYYEENIKQTEDIIQTELRKLEPTNKKILNTNHKKDRSY